MCFQEYRPLYRVRGLPEVVINSNDERAALEHLSLQPPCLGVGKVAVEDVIEPREHSSVLFRESVVDSKVEEPESIWIVGLRKLLVAIGCLRANGEMLSKEIFVA